MTQPKNETESFLLSINKNCARLNKTNSNKTRRTIGIYNS